MDYNIASMDGRDVSVPAAAIETLAGQLSGAVCVRGEDGYDAARQIWNGMIDRYPALVIRCLGAADVMAAMRFIRNYDLLFSVRGGGHNIAGSAVCDAGVLIDLSRMTSVRVDPTRRRAWVEPGVTLGRLDRETQAHGLAVPTGINSTTGVAGLTLGGGFGWTTRKYGMTIDNLVGADVVMADGQLVHASADSHEELFWALRGGGGNFGIVTSFEFQLHPVGPEIYSGLIVYPFAQAKDLLRQHRDIVAQASDELTAWVVLRQAPPLPFLPEAWHGEPVLVFALCYLGSAEDGARAIQPYRDLGEPIADVVGPHAFIDWQAAFDPLLTPGARNYWKSHDFSGLSDAAIDELCSRIESLPTPECEIFIAQVGGAMSRVAAEATAFPARDAHFTMNVHTRWQDFVDDDHCVGWARDVYKAMTPHATGTVYINFMPEDESDRVTDAYAGNYTRLRHVKAMYDPDNVFRMNQNIQPEQAAPLPAE